MSKFVDVYLDESLEVKEMYLLDESGEVEYKMASGSLRAEYESETTGGGGSGASGSGAGSGEAGGGGFGACLDRCYQQCRRLGDDSRVFDLCFTTCEFWSCGKGRQILESVRY